MTDEVLEDHAPCAAICREPDVRHWCWLPKGHTSTHECGCGRFWLNTSYRLELS